MHNCIGKKNLFFLLAIIYSCTLFAQSEFPKEFIAHVRLTSGLLSGKEYKPGLFVGGAQVVPQYTVIEHTLRLGLAVGGFYTNNKINGSIGPTVSLKLTELSGGSFGSLGNLHLTVEHLWGTNNQKLLGAGINADILNRFVVGLISYRDYSRNNWWFQSAIAYRISKLKKNQESFLPKN